LIINYCLLGALCRQFDDWAQTPVNLAVLGIFAGTANIENWAVYFAVVAVRGRAVAAAHQVGQHHRTVVPLVVVAPVVVAAAVVVGANLDRNLSFDCELTDMVIDLWKYFAVN